jgi:hypothetical protein
MLLTLLVHYLVYYVDANANVVLINIRDFL